MNIFVTSDNAAKCARYLDDKRVVKMCSETIQLLTAAVVSHGGKGPVGLTHVSHPCAVWARETRGNYMWLLRHAKALFLEKSERFGSVHMYEDYVPMLEAQNGIIPAGPRTPFANCAANASFGLSFKHVQDTRLAYRLYLTERWKLDKLPPRWYGKTR